MMDVCYRDRSCCVQRQNLISMFSSNPPSRHLPAAKTTGLFLDKEKTNDSKDDNDGGVSFDELWQKEVGVVETLRGESERSKGNQGTILRSRPHLQKCLRSIGCWFWRKLNLKNLNWKINDWKYNPMFCNKYFNICSNCIFSSWCKGCGDDKVCRLPVWFSQISNPCWKLPTSSGDQTNFCVSDKQWTAQITSFWQVFFASLHTLHFFCLPSFHSFL